MVKNTKGGNKHKKHKKQTEDFYEREVPFATDGLQYALVTKILGNCRVSLYCLDGENRLGHIRGTMTKRKKTIISLNDLVLVSLRDFENSKCDIIDKYSPKEVRRLKICGEIPNTLKTNEIVIEEEENDIGIDFAEKDENDEEEIKKKDIDIDAI